MKPRFNYGSAIEFLFERLPMYQRIGSIAFKKDLTNIRRLTELLGNPQDKLKMIHVAGTNGKGTVSHLISFGLQRQGLKVGLYTSPHYLDFRERIKVNGVPMRKSSVSKFINDHHEAILEIAPSFFEITVALAFDYFASEGVDAAVIEVGLGGRLDSTNVIHPLLSVITNISFDHMDMLGDTLGAIAAEKAGIIKKGVPVIIGERQTEIEAVFENKAREMQAELTYGASMWQVSEQSGDPWQRTYKFSNAIGQNITFTTGLTAPYHTKNLITAFAALSKAGNFFDIDFKKITHDFHLFEKEVSYIGRWQFIGKDPMILADSAHNEGGLKYVFDEIKNIPHQKLHIITGVVKDKKLDLILPLFPVSATYYFAKAKIPRGMEATELKEKAQAFGLHGKAYTSVSRALAAARKSADREDLILIAGSIFTVAEVLPKHGHFA